MGSRSLEEKRTTLWATKRCWPQLANDQKRGQPWSSSQQIRREKNSRLTFKLIYMTAKVSQAAKSSLTAALRSLSCALTYYTVHRGWWMLALLENLMLTFELPQPLEANEWAGGRKYMTRQRLLSRCICHVWEWVHEYSAHY